MVKVKINGEECEVTEGMTILQACEEAGLEILAFVIMIAFQLLEIVECAWSTLKAHQSR